MKWLKKRRPKAPQFGLVEESKEGYLYYASGTLKPSPAFKHVLYARTFLRARIPAKSLELSNGVAKSLLENEDRQDIRHAIADLYLLRSPAIEIAFLAEPKIGSTRVILLTAISLPSEYDKRTLLGRIMRTLATMAESMDFLALRQLILENWLSQHFWQLAIVRAYIGRLKE